MNDQDRLPLNPGLKPLEPGHYWLQMIADGSLEVGEWTGKEWVLQGTDRTRLMIELASGWLIGPRIAEPDPSALVLKALT